MIDTPDDASGTEGETTGHSLFEKRHSTDNSVGCRKGSRIMCTFTISCSEFPDSDDMLIRFDHRHVLMRTDKINASP